MPEDVMPASRKKAWFLCDEGHEWETRLYHRTMQRHGCPTCNHKKATSTNCLLAKYPAVAAEWHPTKNNDLTAKDVSYASNSIRVWWQCQKGHEWKSIVSNRTLHSSGCPECGRKRKKGGPRGTQSLRSALPDLAQQWHPTKNGTLTPDTISRASYKAVWWQCPKDSIHEWQTKVFQRSVQHSGCPFCNKSIRLSETNNLLALYPEVAQEWHPTLNGELTADKVTGKSGKKVWWACKGCRHEWQTKVHTRTALSAGCPKCARKRKSVRAC
eukprot:Colp12_sorted_trinity150504_noHs@8666